MKQSGLRAILAIKLIMFTLPSQAAPLIGYGSSDAVLPAKNQELFLMGFEVGLQSALKGRKLPDLLVLDQVADGSQLGAIESARRLLAKGIAILTGFPTSHEALLAARIAKDQGVLTIFAAAGHSDLAKMGPNVFTTGESMNYAIQSTLDFIKLKFKSARGVVISNPYAVFSKNQEDMIVEYLRKPEHSALNLRVLQLRRNLTLSEADLALLKSKKTNFIYLTPYADESAKLLEQFSTNHIDLPLVANSSWTTGDVDFGRRFLTARNSPVYAATLWQKGSQDSRLFEDSIQKRYGRPATSEIAYGFDLGVVVGTTLNGIKGAVTRDSVIAEFKKHGCFEGTTSGKICFDSKGGHARRKFSFARFTKSGFLPLD